MKSILVSAGKGILVEGITNLFADSDEFAVIDAVNDSQPLLNQVLDLHPDIVMIHEADQIDLSKLLSAFPRMCVILFNPKDNWVSIIDKQDLYINRSNELLSEVIRIASRREGTSIEEV